MEGGAAAERVTGGEARRRRARERAAPGRGAALLTALGIALAAWLPTGPAWAIFTSQATSTANTVSTAAGFPRCYSDAVRADNPVSYWRLDEASGTTATDSNGSSAGTYRNGVTLGQPGALPDTIDNRAASFDAVDDDVRVGDVHDFPGTASFSVEFWLNPSSTNSTLWRPVLSKEDPGANMSSRQGWAMWLAPDTNLLSMERWNGSSQHAVASTLGILAGSWYHVAATYDGSTIRLYVNGRLDSSLASSLSLNDHSVPLQFGSVGSYSDPSWYSKYGGLLDDVAVYSTALSATQVRTHYNAGRCSKDGVLADVPVGYWRLGESSGTTALDGVRGRHGTYVNGPTLGVAGALNGDANTAVTFNGSSQYASVPYDAALNPSQFSLEVWARPSGGSQYRTVVSSLEDAGGGTSWRGYWLGINPSNRWEAEVSQSGGSVTALTSPGTASTSTWTHLCLTYDGTTMRFYVDGLLVGSQTTSYRQVLAVPLTIGAGMYNGGTASELFPGSVDEVTVYGSALSLARVQAHYLLARSYQDTVLDSGPVSYWRLGESSGTGATDVKSANAGTYVNTPTLGKAGALAGDADTSAGVNGTSSHVSVPYSATLNPAQFTVEAWAQWDGTRAGNWRTVAGTWNDTGNGGYWLGISTQDKWYVSTQGASWAYSEIQGITSTSGEWVHLAATNDGSTLRLYVNGTQVGSVASPNYVTQSSVPLGIGANFYSGGPGDLLGGIVDDVAVYSRALSAAEVQLHYDSGRQ